MKLEEVHWDEARNRWGMRTRRVVEKVPGGSRPVPSVGEVKLPDPEVASKYLGFSGCRSVTCRLSKSRD